MADDLPHCALAEPGPAQPVSVSEVSQDLTGSAGAPAHADEGPAPTELWPVPMVAHVRMVSSLIEGRRVSWAEILAMLAKVFRQHSIGRRRKIDQTVAWLNENPP